MEPFKIIPPSPERVKVYEQYVKPLLECAVDNNAVDKWMFNKQFGFNSNFLIFSNRLFINFLRS